MWCRIARSDIRRPPPGAAGFTLIEVLVAIAVLAVVLGAIGAVVGNTARAIRSVDRRLPLLETAQSLVASLPTRAALQPGTQSGVSGEFRWRIDSVLLNRNVPDDVKVAKWMPLSITVQVRSSEGPPVRLDTVRLIPRAP